MNKGPEKTKRAYGKPAINRVKLGTQDAILGAPNCKSGDMGTGRKASYSCRDSSNCKNSTLGS